MTMPFIIGASQQKRSGRPFIIKVKYTAGFTFTMPLANGYNYNFIVDWGDGTVGQVTAYNDADRIHVYATGDNGGQPWVVTMTGTLEYWTSNASTQTYLVEVTQWGRTGFKYVNFASCSKLVACYGKLITSQTSFVTMFYKCSTMTYCDVSEWDVSNITSFGTYGSAGMFDACTVLTSLDTSSWVFNSSSNIIFECVFRNCPQLVTIGDTSGWNTGKITSFSNSFYGDAKLKSIDADVNGLDVSTWDVGICTLFTNFFYGCTALTSLDVSSWNVSSGIIFSGLFYGCQNVGSLDVSLWDTSNATNMAGLFGVCKSLTTLDVSSWNVTKVTNFGDNYNFGMFYGIINVTSLDLSGWVLNTTNNVTMIGFCSVQSVGTSKLTTIGDVSGWNTSKITSFQYAFRQCVALTSIAVSSWDTSSVAGAGFQWMFDTCSSLSSVDVSGWDVSKGTDFTGMFRGCSSTSFTSLDLSGWVFSSTSNITFVNVLGGCTKLTTVGDISGWNTDKFINIGGAFANCSSLTSINASSWNLSICTNFGSSYTDGTFAGCVALTSLNVSNWTLNTSGNVTMGGMFYNCQGLTSISFTGWNTSKVTNFSYFMDNCLLLATCDVSVLSTAAATNVSYMFRNCRSMTAINISGWDLSLVTAANMTAYMFYGCYGLTSLTLPVSLSRVDNQFAVFTGTPACTLYNIYRATAPTVSGTPFGNYAKPLHVPVSNSGYDVAPWTDTAIFSSIINDL